MSISKRYLRRKPVCKVTFKIEREAGGSFAEANLVGDFNEWNRTSHPMKPLKGGGFTATVDLEPGREYQFRYLMDGAAWENDWAADGYVPTELGTDNSVVQV
jgi:1,4-alpha-glucan branching enzyme